MKPYESYKKTNIPWLKEIPSHWKISRNNIYFKEVKKIIGEKYKNTQLLSLTTKGVLKKDIATATGKVPDNWNGYQVVNRNQLIMCLFDLDCSAVFSGLSKYNGMISPAYKIFNINNCNIKYADYWFMYIFQNRKYRIYSKSLRYIINCDKFKAIEFFVPPRDEQDQIVKFLDWKISKINKLVNAKKKQIQLLNEQKQAIINKAVTKGLDDNAPMKDSGIFWLGNIPQDWKIIKIKRFASLFNGKEIENEIEKSDCSYNVYGSGGIFKYTGKFLYKGEAVLFGRKGTIGKPLLVNESFWTVDTMYYCVCNKYCLNEYLFNVLKVFPWDFYATKTALPSIVGTEIFNCNIVLPSTLIQKKILKYINEKNIKIDSIVEKFQFEINLLKEYKTSLISSVVTGKIDVRDIVVPKFDIIEETIDDDSEITDNEFDIEEHDIAEEE